MNDESMDMKYSLPHLFFFFPEDFLEIKFLNLIKLIQLN